LKYTLPKLPYSYDALEPHIDKRTMILHHTAHHQSYVDKLNSLLADSIFADKPAEKLLVSLESIPSNIRTEVRHNAGGHANHSFFWPSLSPNSEKCPSGNLLDAIERAFGSFVNLKERFSALFSPHFASGWAWVCLDKESRIILHTTADHDSPLTAGLVPLLVLDLWEHAYYLKFQNRRTEYIDAFWNMVNWTEVGKRFERSIEGYL
jgi:Fe-Mn family superoxide dismutase